MRAAPAEEKVAFIGKVRAFFVVDAFDQLGDKPVQIAVALPMRMRGHVHGHAVYEAGEIGAVVQVKAAQEILIGLAIAAVLRDDHAWHKLQHLRRPQAWAALAINLALTLPWLAASEVPTALS